MNPSYRRIANSKSPLFAKYLENMIELVHECILSERALALASGLADVDNTFPASCNAEEIAETLENCDGGIVLATVGNRVVGLGTSFFITHTRAMIGPLSVSAPYRGNGICTEIIKRIEEGLKSNGCTSTSMIVLRNNAANELYDKLGYCNHSHILAKEL